MARRQSGKVGGANTHGRRDSRGVDQTLQRGPTPQITSATHWAALPALPPAAAPQLAAILTTKCDKLIESEFRVPRVYPQLQKEELEGMVRDGEFTTGMWTGSNRSCSETAITGRRCTEIFQFRRFRDFIFASHTVLFVGFSLTDPDLLAFLDERGGGFGGSR